MIRPAIDVDSARSRVLIDLASREAVARSQGRKQLWPVDITDDGGRLVVHGGLRLQDVAISERTPHA
jgi:hypothetical protein